MIGMGIAGRGLTTFLARFGMTLLVFGGVGFLTTARLTSFLAGFGCLLLIVRKVTGIVISRVSHFLDLQLGSVRTSARTIESKCNGENCKRIEALDERW